MSKKAILIVHPFTSEKYLYKTVKERGYKIITLITPFDVNWIKLCMETINQYSDFILNVTADVETDLIPIKKLIKENDLELKGVINAFDASILYSDTLTNELLGTNIDLKYSKIRCDKYEVNEELAKHSDIPVIKSVLIENKQGWQEDLSDVLKDFKYPVIIKPAADSAARNSMAIVDNANEVNQRLNKLFMQHSMFVNKPHSKFIVQEYIEGEEFFINAAILGKEHKIGGIFKYKKQPNKFLGLISFNKEENQDCLKNLINYHHKCMEGLHITYGMVHVEYIIENHSKRPYLVEINNRLAGIEIPFLSQECYHTDEVTIILDLFEGKNITEYNSENIFAYSALPYLTNYFNEQATKIDLKNIESNHEVITFRKGIVKRAKEEGELFDKVSAALWLLNKDYGVLTKDVNLLRDREANGTLFI